MLIWWLIERGRVRHLESILPQVRAHLAFRLQTHLGTLTLTNIPYQPITLVPLGIAAWATLSAIALGVDEARALQFLKCHSGHIEVLEAAVGLVGYGLPEEAQDFLVKWRVFGEIRSAVQHGGGELRLWAVRACHRVLRLDRASIRSDLFPRIVDEISIDGEPPESQVIEAFEHLPRWFVDMSAGRRRSVARMLTFCDAGELTYGDFDRDVATIGWEYGIREFEIPEVPICAATCRPYYVDPSRHIVWHEASRSIFGEVRHQIHIHWYFIECVTKLKAFPTKDEFLLFVFNDIVPKHKSSLPFRIDRFVDLVFRGHAALMRDLTASRTGENCSVNASAFAAIDGG
jgi:hypothetical protein